MYFIYYFAVIINNKLYEYASIKNLLSQKIKLLKSVAVKHDLFYEISEIICFIRLTDSAILILILICSFDHKTDPFLKEFFWMQSSSCPVRKAIHWLLIRMSYVETNGFASLRVLVNRYAL